MLLGTALPLMTRGGITRLIIPPGSDELVLPDAHLCWTALLPSLKQTREHLDIEGLVSHEVLEVADHLTHSTGFASFKMVMICSSV